MTTRGDVVLIYYRRKPSFFARIDSIEPDIKKDWFRVQLLILTIPLRTVTWILREEYIRGVPFTMDGNSIRIEAVSPLIPKSDSRDTRDGAAKKVATKVIPFVKSKEEDMEGT